MKKRKGDNVKRRILSAETARAQRARLDLLSGAAVYGGHPAHKRNPGDFGLDPPAQPREGKTLCDGVSIFERDKAIALLREGLACGLVSEQQRNGWPQNVWAVAADGSPLEAQLDNSDRGSYHGYPLQLGDPLWDLVVERWNERERR